MTSPITNQPPEAHNYHVSSKSSHKYPDPLKITLLMLQMLSLASACNSGRTLHSHEYVQLTSQYGDVDMPTRQMAEDISSQCTSEQSVYHKMHFFQVLQSSDYLDADIDLQEQIVNCTALQVAKENAECVSDKLIGKTLDPTSSSKEMQEYLSSLTEEKTCEAYEMHGIGCDTSSAWEKTREARLALLTKASEQKSYFKSHVKMLREIEAERTKLQCKNLQQNIRDSKKRNSGR